MIIGIDPDAKKSAIAIIKDNKLTLSEVKFFELFRFLYENRKEIRLVVVEAGYLNEKANWHNNKSGVYVAARIGKNVGENHQTARLIVEMCLHLGLNYKAIEPLGTKKIDQEKFKQITRYEGRTNQDTRDAGMIAWNYKNYFHEI